MDHPIIDLEDEAPPNHTIEASAWRDLLPYIANNAPMERTED